MLSDNRDTEIGDLAFGNMAGAACSGPWFSVQYKFLRESFLRNLFRPIEIVNHDLVLVLL